VLFLVDGEQLGSVETPPYTFEWEVAPVGSHRLSAVALDNDGQQVMMDIMITVLDNLPPTVDLTQPGDGNVFQVGDVILAVAQASDVGGKISRVEFYVRDADLFGGPDLLVERVEEAPYVVEINDLKPGLYMLFAVAIDDGDTASQSIPVMFEVRE
jgi:hypothetical protein